MKHFLHLSLRILACSPLLLAITCKKDVKEGNINGPSNSSDVVTTREYWVSPKTTDTTITTFLSTHFVTVQTGGILKNILVVYIPGTNRTPSSSRAFTMKAASMGYHALSLTYQNNTTGNGICASTGDTSCHRRLRSEVLDGIDRHPSVVISPVNSVIHRLTKLLIYLHKAQPTQGWGQYILNGQVNWSKVIVSGHSQGGALAGLIGKLYPVRRIVMFSIVDYLDNGKIPSWETLPANNENYYALTNQNDELIPWNKVRYIWTVTGWLSYGSVKNVDYILPPYSNTHMLITNRSTPSTSIDPYHNMTGVDSYIPKNAQGRYVYEKAWEYFLKP